VRQSWCGTVAVRVARPPIVRDVAREDRRNIVLRCRNSVAGAATPNRQLPWNVQACSGWSRPQPRSNIARDHARELRENTREVQMWVLSSAAAAAAMPVCIIRLCPSRSHAYDRVHLSLSPFGHCSAYVLRPDIRYIDRLHARDLDIARTRELLLLARRLTLMEMGKNHIRYYVPRERREPLIKPPSKFFYAEGRYSAIT